MSSGVPGVSSLLQPPLLCWPLPYGQPLLKHRREESGVVSPDLPRRASRPAASPSLQHSPHTSFPCPQRLPHPLSNGSVCLSGWWRVPCCSPTEGWAWGCPLENGHEGEGGVSGCECAHQHMCMAAVGWLVGLCGPSSGWKAQAPSPQPALPLSCPVDTQPPASLAGSLSSTPRLSSGQTLRRSWLLRSRAGRVGGWEWSVKAQPELRGPSRSKWRSAAPEEKPALSTTCRRSGKEQHRPISLALQS